MGDFKGSINAFGIMGPKSSQVINGTLSPVGSEDRGEFKKVWHSQRRSTRANLQTAGNLPREWFHPKNAKPSFLDMTNPPALPSNDLTFPSSGVAQTKIWADNKRDVLKKPEYKKKDLDERHSKFHALGSKLNPLRQVDRIQIVLIQYSLEMRPPFSGQRERKKQSFEDRIPGFPMLYPSSCVCEVASEQRAESERVI
ncbi:hypothetical protein J3A83DRAFT_4368144 [Scleroderma citrinum]